MLTPLELARLCPRAPSSALDYDTRALQHPSPPFYQKHSRASEADLQDAFSRFGRVEQIALKDGFAFATFLEERDAEACVRGAYFVLFGRDAREQL